MSGQDFRAVWGGRWSCYSGRCGARHRIPCDGPGRQKALPPRATRRASPTQTRPRLTRSEALIVKAWVAREMP